MVFKNEFFHTRNYASLLYGWRWQSHSWNLLWPSKLDNCLISSDWKNIVIPPWSLYNIDWLIGLLLIIGKSWCIMQFPWQVDLCSTDLVYLRLETCSFPWFNYTRSKLSCQFFYKILPKFQHFKWITWIMTLTKKNGCLRLTWAAKS